MSCACEERTNEILLLVCIIIAVSKGYGHPELRLPVSKSFNNLIASQPHSMSNIELESDSYDVVVIGTGIAESIAAAALAKAGKTVLHLDPNEYYGGEQASLTLDELVEWSTKRVESSSAAVSYTHASTSVLTPTLQNDRRRYALSLFPAILPSRGPLIDALISSDVSKYVSFKLLDSVNIWDEGCAGTRKVPGCKEEIFKDKSVSLMDKRKLMKFFMFAAGEFEHNDILRGEATGLQVQYQS